MIFYLGVSAAGIDCRHSFGDLLLDFGTFGLSLLLLLVIVFGRDLTL